MITQGDQEPEVERITNLNILGYQHGAKGKLNAHLKTLIEKSLEEKSTQKILRLKQDSFSDAGSKEDLYEDEETAKDFEHDTISHLKGILSIDTPPILVYLPTSLVMKKLILKTCEQVDPIIVL